jgi:multiple sugar transport system substrate-binding protein
LKLFEGEKTMNVSRSLFRRLVICLTLCALTLGAIMTGRVAQAQPVKVVILAGQDASTAPLKDMINEKLADKATGFQVEWVEFPYDGLYEKATQCGNSKCADYDLIMGDDPWVPQFAASGYLENLTAMGYTPDPDLVKATVDIGWWPPQSGPRVPGISPDEKPQLYALSVIGDVQIFFYRKDLVKEAPKTWDDINKIGETMADKSKNIYALAMRGVKGNPIVTEWFPYLYSYGGEIFDDKWNVKFNSPEGVAALEEFVGLMKYQPDGVAAFDSAEQGACYLQGQCITNIEWTGWILAAEDPAQSKVVGKTGWTTTPGKVRSASELGTWIMGINANAPHKAEALKVLQWILGEDAQRELANRKGVPVRTSVYTDKDLDAKYPWLPVILNALNGSVARPRTPDWAQVEATLGLHLNNAVTGKEKPQEALDNAAKEVTKILTDAGYYK